MGLLNRWTSFKAELRTGKTNRPRLAKDCHSIDQVLEIRREMVREINEKVEKIQNPGLGVQRLRELNDEINIIFRRKHHWEMRLKELGGPSFPNDSGGRYQYFGAARQLEEVKELLNPEEDMVDHKGIAAKRNRDELLQTITYRYYDTIDTEDQDEIGLLQAEKSEEARLEQTRSNVVHVHSDPLEEHPDEVVKEFEKQLLETVLYSTLPHITDEQREQLDTAKSMEKIVVAQKKKLLMAKYLL